MRTFGACGEGANAPRAPSLVTGLDGDYQLDLRGTDFGDLIGFEKKLVTKTEYGRRLPNITKSIDSLNINTTAI